MSLKRKILNKIIILFCTLFSLTSCTGGTKIYKGIEVRYNGITGIYYPKTSLGVHINSTCKDFDVEYLQVINDEVRGGKGSTSWIEKGVTIKFIDKDNVVYLPEGSYSLFEGKCPLH